MHAPIHPRITTRQVFAIAGPAMVANLTTPLIGIVSTTAVGRLDDAALLGGVAMASAIFDCLFWLFAFLRMSTLAFTAQAQGAGETREFAAILVRGFIVAGLIGTALIALQLPLAAVTFSVMGGSEGVTYAARTYFMIRIWSAPLALANYVILGWLVGQARPNLALMLQIVINLINMAATVLLVLVYGAGIAGAAIAAVLAEATGFALGVVVAWHLAGGGFAVPRATLFDRAKLMRMLAVNRDIMIRTAALIIVFLFFTAKGAREGDVTLAANSVLNNFLLVSAFFLDGLANAAQQLCGRAFGARDARGFADSTRLVLLWGIGFALVVCALFALFGPVLIDLMTTSDGVRRSARDFLLFVILAPLPGVFAFGFDGIYVGATWAREMRNLMLLSLAIFLASWWAFSAFGNAGLWTALLGFYVARGGLQGLRYAALFRKSFKAV
ncbi:MATE family efflux transporter [Bradyrhizobium sp. ISRA443]|uniref:MATE family efflux transporter n=1 Tax=unclassified Bradyrhizobium TaxID=2631580 RepID=UPI0024785D7D|nr:MULTISPECIES: MATE family efflux transporter [unclassified Bradyrhizobium]WGR98707.1 MATE family efflux transporter [Bradyrhizobium sp. ISRA436]WGS05597.1 MATE family efflux transporter [Bradyrhizobium sp. ISRA437]WGS12484.1 MATE family efflux transporter [Bradyrhizobium sp. ISRA443]